MNNYGEDFGGVFATNIVCRIFLIRKGKMSTEFLP